MVNLFISVLRYFQWVKALSEAVAKRRANDQLPLFAEKQPVADSFFVATAAGSDIYPLKVAKNHYFHFLISEK